MRTGKRIKLLLKTLNFTLISAFFAVFLFACDNEVEKVAAIISLDSIPQITSENTEVLYSDSSFVKMRLKTPLLEKYTESKKPYTEFRKGVSIQFLNRNKKVTSSLTADYSKYIDKNQIWEFRGNVHHISETKTELKTELLYVNRTTEKMYSDSNILVKIEYPDYIMEGKGFESDINLYNATMMDFVYIPK